LLFKRLHVNLLSPVCSKFNVEMSIEYLSRNKCQGRKK
jgi:hypothetical protein